ncbi:hypothetical protein [Peribacillus frigoritolerans]|uniref:hypothetical protein n=1 Tax=Peribacillus frigoritolerans TaxID=450367 RepID=UPI0010592F3D|nr:hypothetical protein [Peribacillus frigoritolerans]TDL82790.1 hypothetical protein E2R53_04300 [Peribacillus frigoritolerans]
MKDVQEIRIQYVFFGDVNRATNLIESEEGSLSLIDNDDILNQNVSATTKEIVMHYRLFKGRSTEKVFVGAMKSNRGEPQISWSLLEDWEEAEQG